MHKNAFAHHETGKMTHTFTTLVCYLVCTGFISICYVNRDWCPVQGTGTDGCEDISSNWRTLPGVRDDKEIRLTASQLPLRRLIKTNLAYFLVFFLTLTPSRGQSCLLPCVSCKCKAIYSLFPPQTKVPLLSILVLPVPQQQHSDLCILQSIV